MSGIHQQEKKELRRILSQAGYKRTKDILAILDTFLATEAHQTPADLRKRLRRAGLNFDTGIIQEALDIFCKYGFAQRKEFSDRETCYEHQHLGDHHDHLICTRCGRLEEFISPEMEELQTKLAREKGFIPLKHRMEIYGLCSRCGRERGTAVPLAQAEPGEQVTIAGHVGGNEIERRLNDMGLTRGVEIEVLNRNGGPVLVSCRDSRLALGKGISEKILVSPSKQPKTASTKRQVKKKE
ncbi:MAG: transcriptional repressor [Deltaproteobacteria bacterium]|nr:transcriptional repressor [Deltaproteobacteria bacterium]MBW2051277.1 transcriptional repressor [Deltaproteobacteria bacterium]MBW2139913.1 transcriptional repressor [Deltaproteobacteria bacterium]MBW2322378.1 transcriptional repressor [Deltaproteobacteria bacterium]